ncbi:NUDIX hydrolase [Moraxella atlantae]|uniref:ADP-ribose pyrophosphatase n=1 Tax=Faucicola atlantae TaxID=34059 RepID=A0A1B8QJX4_9GAMM|nr:NUDIX hydrolase [Moraxella atlantae]OBX83781.1 ADP-ribose pyrophosphatase [Moraxella atlantae]OPH36600.1 NUDIX hydrolase [Moraxella atlantae]STY94378.1 NADH pyrophosphatase [Moraxella atlantae]
MAYCMQCGHAADRVIPAGDTRPRLVCPACGYIHYDNPKVINGCVLVHDNKILLCRRAIEPRRGFWTLPAGFMELGETMRDGGNRECMEEAEAQGENLQLYCLYDIPSIGQIHVMFLGTLKNGQFGVGEESLECALFAEQDIPWDDLAFQNVIETLRFYFADRQAGATLGKFPLHQKTIERNRDAPDSASGNP